MHGQVIIDEIDSALLRGNRPGDPTRRRIPVYLPPSYASNLERRYPVIYLLNGYSGTGMTFLNYQCFAPNLPERVDALIVSGRMQEAIVVMADGMTRYGGSQFLDSSATGPYQKFLCDETVAFIDGRYRTVPRREARAVAGKSSGGYGAIMAAMQRPQTFAACACHSGDMYFDFCYLPDVAKSADPLTRHGSLQAWLDHFESLPKLRGSDFTTICTVAMASVYSPDDRGDGDGLGFWLPFDPTSGALRDDVWRRWLEHDPVRIHGRHAAALRNLSLLFIDVGSADEYNLQIGARLLHDGLEKDRVPHRYEEFKDGHRDTSYRYAESLPALRAALVDA